MRGRATAARPTPAGRRRAPLARVRVAGLLLIALAATATPARPQTGAAPHGDPTTPPAAPRSGLMFLVRDNFTLDAFDGAAVSYRRRPARGGGWRLGADVRGAFGSTTYRDEYADSTATRSAHDQHWSTTARLQWVGETAGRRGVSVFWAAGPALGLGASRNWSSGVRSETRSSNWNAGLAGNLGVEYLVADRVSLLAEYAADAAFFWSRDETFGVSPRRMVRNSRSFDIQARSVRLGLTAWFH
jgi:opacity protein-like surface antigen